MRKQVDKGGVKHVSVGESALPLSLTLDSSMRPLDMRDNALKVINERGKGLTMVKMEIEMYLFIADEADVNNSPVTEDAPTSGSGCCCFCFDHAHYHN